MSEVFVVVEFRCAVLVSFPISFGAVVHFNYISFCRYIINTSDLVFHAFLMWLFWGFMEKTVNH